jgi:hypothetical protein
MYPQLTMLGSFVPKAAVSEPTPAISGDPIVLPIAIQGFSRFEVAIAPHDITATDEDPVTPT